MSGHARILSIVAALAASSAMLVGTTAIAADAAKAPVPAAQSGSQVFATELLNSMANYLAGLPGFEVSLATSYDAPQPSGQLIEFNELREVSLARPDRLRVRQVRSDGFEDLVVFDGKTMSILDGEGQVYAQAPQPGSLDDAIVYFVRELGMRLPAAAMLTTRFPKELASAVKTVDYVEYTTILPQPAHHIAGRTGAVDFQVWISDVEGSPLPLRMILTYLHEPERPQFRAQFLEWKLEVPTDSALFSFTPPESARQIAFAVQVPAMVSGAAASEGARP